MSDLSRYCFTGRLTADASIRTLASGKMVMTAPVAVNTGYGDYKKTMFIKVQMWGDRSAKIVNYLKKGTLIASDGEPSRNEWTTAEGRAMVDFVVDVMNINILAAKKDDVSQGNSLDGDGAGDVEW